MAAQEQQGADEAFVAATKPVPEIEGNQKDPLTLPSYVRPLGNQEEVAEDVDEPSELDKAIVSRVKKKRSKNKGSA